MFYQIAFECYSIRWSVRMQIVVAWPQVSINPHHELTDELKEEKFHWKTAYFPFHRVQVLLASTRRFNVQFHRFYALTHLWLINIFYGSKVKLTLFNFIYNRPTGHNFNSGYRQSNGNKKLHISFRTKKKPTIALSPALISRTFLICISRFIRKSKVTFKEIRMSLHQTQDHVTLWSIQRS